MYPNDYVLVHSDYLEHHGIFGQRWGIRRYQNKDGTLTPLGKKHAAINEGREYKEEAVIRSKSENIKRESPVSGLSDEELKEKINRLKLEKEYRELLFETRMPISATDNSNSNNNNGNNKKNKNNKNNSDDMSISRLGKEIMYTAVQDAGTAAATKFVKEFLGGMIFGDKTALNGSKGGNQNR